MTATTEVRRRLARLMDLRRAELDHLEWKEVAARGGTSVATLRRIRNSDAEITADNEVAIEDGLDWQRGSVAAILAGHDPVPLSTPIPLTPLQREALTELDRLMAQGVPEDEAIDRVVQNTRDAAERSRQNRRHAG